MLNRYQNKKIKVTTQDGAEFTGIADGFPPDTACTNLTVQRRASSLTT